jgi:hypothetical protein
MTCHDLFRQQLIRELRRSYRRNRSILHLYWAMGDLPECLTLDREELLQILANSAAQRAARCFTRLQQLGKDTVISLPSPLERVICWAVLQGGRSLTMLWIERLERQDLKAMTSLFLETRNRPRVHDCAKCS